MHISGRAVLGTIVVLGCAVVSSSGGPRGADATVCSVSAPQLSRAAERSMYEVLERLCPAVARSHLDGRQIRVYIDDAGEPRLFGYATSLRNIHPEAVRRARFIPFPVGEAPGVSIILLEMRLF